MIKGSKQYKGPAKLAARQETIIDRYRECFGHSLPPEKQYWTLAGAVGKDGKINPDCELFQLEKAGLIKRNQFYGVDSNEEVIERNKEFLPDVNWITNCFWEEMVRKNSKGQYNPGIVNFDHVKMPKKAARDFVDVFKLLSQDGIRNVLLIFNFMTLNPRNGIKSSFKEMLDILGKKGNYYNNLDKWVQEVGYYKYAGAGGQGAKEFTSLVYIKK